MTLATALVSLLALMLQWALFKKKEKTREEKIADVAKGVGKRALHMRKKIEDGLFFEIADDLDDLERRTRLLLRLRKERKSKG